MSDDNKQTHIQAARDSFSGRSLTDTQFSEAWALSGIIRGEINRSGSFHEKLTDYAHAFARNERFDAMRSEAILRDIYKGRYGETMNQTRETLLAAENELPQAARNVAFAHADSIPGLIQAGETMPFYQAYDRMAVRLAGELGITQSGAKVLMKESYAAVYDQDLYKAGKEVEQAYHKPVRDAGNAPCKTKQLLSHSRN